LHESLFLKPTHAPASAKDGVTDHRHLLYDLN
jgi:hypothetical protein